MSYQRFPRQDSAVKEVNATLTGPTQLDMRLGYIIDCVINNLLKHKVSAFLVDSLTSLRVICQHILWVTDLTVLLDGGTDG